MLSVETLTGFYQLFTAKAWPMNLYIAVMLLVEWLNRGREHGLDLRGIRPGWLRWAVYYLLVAAVLLFGAESSNFIYFQF